MAILSWWRDCKDLGLKLLPQVNRFPYLRSYGGDTWVARAPRFSSLIHRTCSTSPLDRMRTRITRLSRRDPAGQTFSFKVAPWAARPAWEGGIRNSGGGELERLSFLKKQVFGHWARVVGGGACGCPSAWTFDRLRLRGEHVLSSPKSTKQIPSLKQSRTFRGTTSTSEHRHARS